MVPSPNEFSMRIDGCSSEFLFADKRTATINGIPVARLLETFEQCKDYPMPLAAVHLIQQAVSLLREIGIGDDGDDFETLLRKAADKLTMAECTAVPKNGEPVLYVLRTPHVSITNITRKHEYLQISQEIKDRTGLPVFVFDPSEGLQAMTEEDMTKLGWVRQSRPLFDQTKLAPQEDHYNYYREHLLRSECPECHATVLPDGDKHLRCTKCNTVFWKPQDIKLDLPKPNPKIQKIMNDHVDRCMKAEAEAKIAEAQFKDWLNNSPIMSMMLDEHGHNHAAEKSTFINTKTGERIETPLQCKLPADEKQESWRDRPALL